MLIVADDRAVVEADLAAGRLCRPRCGVGVLGGWGCARLREVRAGEGCGDCGRVAVVSREDVPRDACAVANVCLSRRRYAVEVIGEALLSLGREGIGGSRSGWGFPGETVRDWRQRFRSRAELIAAHFLRWARALDASVDPRAGQGSLVGDALEAIGVCTRLASLVPRSRPPSSWVSALTAGGLLSINTEPPWPAPE